MSTKKNRQFCYPCNEVYLARSFSRVFSGQQAMAESRRSDSHDPQGFSRANLGYLRLRVSD